MARTDVVEGPARHFEYKNRPRRDVWATVVLGIVALLFFVGGFVAVAHRDTNFLYHVTSDHMAKSDSCPAEGPGRKLIQVDPSSGDQPEQFQPAFFLNWVLWWVLFSVVFSVAMGVLLVHLFIHSASRMIKVAIAIILSTFAAYALAFGVSGLFLPMGLSLLMLALYAFTFYLWHDKFPLLARLLSVTSAGLQQNTNIALVPLVTPLVLGLTSLPILVFMAAAAANGRVVADPAVRTLADGTCVRDAAAAAPGDQPGAAEPANCCTWQPDAWVPPYLFLGTLLWMWLVFLADQVKTFIISGTIAQWYFAPVGSSTGGNLLRSTKHALGASLGSLCLSSAILTVVNYLRQLAERGRDRNGNLVTLVLSCIANCFYSMLQFLTKFATIRMAIVGDSFFAAASSVFGLLTRHLLNTVAVWWLPPLFLNLYVFTISLAWGVSAGLLNYFASLRVLDSRDSALATAIGLGAVSFIMCAIVLGFIVGLMLHIVDTVYICYALELEANTCSKPEVHEVYGSLPKPKPVAGDVVQNPDGNFAYARPQQDSETAPLLPNAVIPPPQGRMQG